MLIYTRLEAAEVNRVGPAIAKERGLSYTPSQPGEYLSGRLAGSVNLASGRFAIIDDGLGFQLVPWRPVLEIRSAGTSPVFPAMAAASSGALAGREG